MSPINNKLTHSLNHFQGLFQKEEHRDPARAATDAVVVGDVPFPTPSLFQVQFLKPLYWWL